MNKVIAMILAGGKGTRMGILCRTRPKPMLPFAGDHRVIDFTLCNCVQSKIDNFAVLIDHQRSVISSYLTCWQSEHIERARLAVLEPVAGSYSGTADAVFQNLEFLERSLASIVVILAGDHVYSMDYRPMIAYHRQNHADVTIGVVSVPIEEADRFGTVLLDGDGRIISFEEKTSQPKSNLASMGIYVFNKDILFKRLKEDSEKLASPHDFGYAVIPRMIKHNKVFAYKFDGYWQDIGTPESYYRAASDYVGGKLSIDQKNSKWPKLTIDEAAPSNGTIKKGYVENSIIGRGCIIRGQVINSILSSAVTVEEDARVSNSVLFNDVHIGRYSIVDSSILDEGVYIGELCYVGYRIDHGQNENISIIGQGAFVSSNCVISAGSQIEPFSRAFGSKTNPLARN